MTYELSTVDYKKLRLLQQDVKLSRRHYRKVTVLVMLHQGHRIEVIEAALGLDDNTIRRYWTGYQNEGIKTYLADHYVPYSGKLSDEQESHLCDHLDEYLYDDLRHIIDYVKTHFAVAYSRSGMRDLLHRLGFVYKRSKSVPSKAEESAQRDFLENRLPGLLAQAVLGEAEVYFADGCHPTHNTKAGRGWIRKGQDFPIDCNNGRKRVNINGAIRATKPEHMVYDITDSINAQSTQRLCRKLLKKHPGKKIYLIVDNARYNRNKMLQNWAKNKRIEFVFLPAYSPNLNLIERLWALLKKDAINSSYYPTFEEFKNGIIYFLDNLKSIKGRVRSLLTLNFRTVEQKSYYLSQTIS